MTATKDTGKLIEGFRAMDGDSENAVQKSGVTETTLKRRKTIHSMSVSDAAVTRPANQQSNRPRGVKAMVSTARASLLLRSKTMDSAFLGRAMPPPRPPRIIQRSELLTRAYYVNHEWKSVAAKTAVIIYMSVIFGKVISECSPWYEFFYYLTLQGWTLLLMYFISTLYLDLKGRVLGRPDRVPLLERTAAQALSEVAFAVQVVIVAFFWIIVYPQEPWRKVTWELHCHGAGLALAVGDYLYRYTSFSLRNHRFVLAFAAAYTTTYCYVALCLNRPLYPGVDMRSVRSILIFLAGLSTVVITHKVVYVMSNWHRIRSDAKSVLGISTLILFRQNSVDLLNYTAPFPINSPQYSPTLLPASPDPLTASEGDPKFPFFTESLQTKEMTADDSEGATQDESPAYESSRTKYTTGCFKADAVSPAVDSLSHSTATL